MHPWVLVFFLLKNKKRPLQRANNKLKNDNKTRQPQVQMDGKNYKQALLAKIRDLEAKLKQRDEVDARRPSHPRTNPPRVSPPQSSASPSPSPSPSPPRHSPRKHQQRTPQRGTRISEMIVDMIRDIFNPTGK